MGAARSNKERSGTFLFARPALQNWSCPCPATMSTAEPVNLLNP